MQKMEYSEHKTEWVVISVDEYESMKATIETLSSPEAMRKIRQGEEDRRAGRMKPLEQVKKELGL